MEEKGKSANWRIALGYCLFAGFVLLTGYILGYHVLEYLRHSKCWFDPRDCDARIASAINQARTVIAYVYSSNDNYDKFDCGLKDMMFLCQEIDRSYGKRDRREPIVIHDAPINSKAVCVYSPLNMKKEHWYCADSEGHAGYTSIDPGSRGYCVEGESAVCPPLPTDIP